MKSRKLFKIIPIALLIIMMLTVFSSCIAVDVNIGRNGSGTAIVTIAKSEGVTEESIRSKFEEIALGVKAKSIDENRIKIKSIKETAESFVVTLSFRRINYTRGIGSFDYKKSSDFVKERNKVELIASKYAKGVYPGLDIYYNDSQYKFDNATRPNQRVAFSPIDAQTGSKIDAAEFTSENGVLANTKRGMVFTFFIADFPEIESITFSFEGKIKVYGSKDIELIDENTVKVKPVVQTGTKIYFEDKTSTTPITEKDKEIEVFAGYVFFELSPNWALIGILSLIGLTCIGLLIYGLYCDYIQSYLKSKKFRTLVKNYDLYLMMVPAIVLMALFCYLPMSGVIMAFKNFKIDDGIWGSEWAGLGGLKHFIDLITKPSADFGKLARNTVILAGLKFVFGFVCAIVLAVLFSYLKDGIFKKSVQTISYFPYFVSWVVISSIVYLFLASATGDPTDPATFSDQGILNKLIIRLGGTPKEWYSSPQYWRTILTFTAMWKTVGYSTIVYLAAITSINPSLYEAASIDGAGRVKQLWHVTIPGLFPVLGVQVIFSLGNLVKDDFDQIYTLTNGSGLLSETTEVIGTIVYKSIGSPSSYSDAAAMGLMQGLVALVLVLVSNKLIKKLGVDGVF